MLIISTRRTLPRSLARYSSNRGCSRRLLQLVGERATAMLWPVFVCLGSRGDNIIRWPEGGPNGTGSRRASRYHGTPTPGFCGVTEEAAPNRCARDDAGAWPLSTLHECVLACAACRRCRFLSFCAANKDCSWYYSCERPAELSPLHLSTVRSYTTLNASLLSVHTMAPADECSRRMAAVIATREHASLPEAQQQHAAAAPRHGSSPLSLAIATLMYPQAVLVRVRVRVRVRP